MTTITRRGSLRAIAGATIVLSFGARAQGYPSKAITIICPYPAGGLVDSLARTLGERLAKRLGQTVIVDNRAGASGMLGIDAMVKAPADGHTLALTLTSPVLTNRFLFKKMPYNPDKDIALVSQIAVGLAVLAVNPKVPANNLQELMKYISANKGKLAYGSFGIGSAAHLWGSHLSQALGAEMSHVPYKGEAPMVQDLVGGQITMAFCSPLQARSFADVGKLKAIAVTGEARSPALPAIPTFAEQGVKDEVFAAGGWVALVAPGGTPKPVIQRLAEEVKTVIALPEVRERILSVGLLPSYLGPDELAAQYKIDMKIWEKVVLQSGATLD
jgi:tripartite-type tricarboxylate transporter receptor subunit TctC